VNRANFFTNSHTVYSQSIVNECFQRSKLPELTQDLCVKLVDRSLHGQISAFSHTASGFESDYWHLQQRGRYQRGWCRSDLVSDGCGGSAGRNGTAPMTPQPLEDQQ